MRILITGPAGFIGSTVLKLALRHNHQVAGLYCPGEAPSEDLARHPGLTRLRGTLADAPWQAINSFAPEVCVHTAWITTPGVYMESPDNHRFLEWSLAFLNQLRGAGLRRIVALGTCIEYKIERHNLSEDHTPIAPMSLYARCKNALRLALMEESRFRGLSIAWCRVFYPYGVGEHPLRLCSSTIQKVMRSEKIVLQTPDSTKDYIYIDDLAAALMVLVERGFHGAINLGAGMGIPVKLIARQIAEQMGKPELVEMAIQTAPDPFDYVVADAGRLRALGWRPQVALAEGLNRLIRHLVKP